MATIPNSVRDSAGEVTTALNVVWDANLLEYVRMTQPAASAGDATASNQVTGNTSLNSIDGKLPALSGGRVPVVLPPGSTGLTDTELRASAVPVSMASAPLPTGAATQVTLASALTELQSILAKLNASIAVTGAFYQATQPVSAVSLPLPTGAATETTLAGVRTVLDNVSDTVNSAITGAHPVLDTRAILFAVNPGGTYGNVERTTGGNLKVAVEEFDAALPAGTNNIGDVDVLSSALPSNAAQETGGNLATLAGTVKAEDAAATSADTGVSIVAVRQDIPTIMTSADGDYTHIRSDAYGRLFVTSDVLRDVLQAQLDAQQIILSDNARSLAFLSVQSGGFIPVPERIAF